MPGRRSDGIAARVRGEDIGRSVEHVVAVQEVGPHRCEGPAAHVVEREWTAEIDVDSDELFVFVADGLKLWSGE